MGRRGLRVGVMAAALALLCLFVQPHAFAADTLTNVKEPPLFTAWPRRTAEGFLWLAENDPLGAFVVEDDPREQQDEFVHIDQEAGQYIYLSEDLAADAVRLSPDLLARLDALINQHTVTGARYNALSSVEVDTEEFTAS